MGFVAKSGRAFQLPSSRIEAVKLIVIKATGIARAFAALRTVISQLLVTELECDFIASEQKFVVES